MAACAIVVKKQQDGTYRATCPVFPKLKARGKTAVEARRAMEKAIERHLGERNQAV